jgi:hypothetical protein
MKHKLTTIALALAFSGAARADFQPITLTAGSYTRDMVIEKTAAAAPSGAATTASMDAGVGNTGYSWYEQGYDAGALTTGLPAAGSTFASATFPTHHYKMATSYTANNAAFIDSTHSATLTPATPAAFGALSFLTSAGNGPVTIAYVVHHADSSTETGNFDSKDWFGNTPVALNANGRADVQTGAFDSVNNSNPRLYSVDIGLANRASAVTSIDLSWDPSNTGGGVAAVFALSGQAAGPVTLGQTIQWGLTITNINNSHPPDLVTNSDGSITIIAGGGDTYGNPDSFTYAYQQVTGDFDIRVRVMNVQSTVTNHGGSIAPKGSLMVRASLDSDTNDFQINATPLLPFQVDGHIETIGRIIVASDTDDLPGRGLMYGPGGGVSEPYQGDTTDFEYCTYPDIWLRVQRQGERLMSYLATANPTNVPDGWQNSPGSTVGWQLLGIVHAAPPSFPKTLYVGISTVAHNGGDPTGTGLTTATYASYGPTPNPPSTPSSSGAPAIPGTGPGPFPNTKVLAANFDASVSANGMGYPPDIVQSSQGAAQPIVWNSGGFSGVARDIIANISSQTPDGFSFARYQAGAFDFLLSPRDPVAALGNLGPYSNPARERYSTGGTNVAASQAWAPSPNYGFVYTTIRKNGQQWNDTSPFFYAATYVQLDGVATGQGYDMIGGHFRGAQFYTRSTKLVTGSPTDPSSDTNGLQRCAMPISIAWFPYDQGWKAGYFDSPQFNTTTAGIPYWKRGNGWGLNSGTALSGWPVAGGQALYNSPQNLLTWVDLGGGTFTGLATLSLSGINSTSDGMLFTIGNDENNSKRGPSASNAALHDGSGWYVAVRDMETSKADPTVYATGGGSDAGASFSFVYIPYNADNLIGGHINTNGSTIKGTGSFSISHLSTGRYALTIPGKADTNGVLLLQNTGYLVNQPGGMTNVVDNSYLSYEYGGTNTPANAFIIETRYVDDSGGGEGVVRLRDAEFNFVYVDFVNPVAPPGTVPPVLTISRSDATHVVVSWSNGPGFVLQKTSTLTNPASWTDVGTANPSAPILVGSTPVFFKVRSP